MTTITAVILTVFIFAFDIPVVLLARGAKEPKFQETCQKKNSISENSQKINENESRNNFLEQSNLAWHIVVLKIQNNSYFIIVARL